MDFEEIAEFEVRVKDVEICGGQRIKHYIQVTDEECGIPIQNPLSLDVVNLPAGTRIKIEVPVCPECNQSIASSGQAICECGFSWVDWIEREYIY